MACCDSEGMHADFAVIEYNITADCESFSCTITFLSNAVHTICSASYLCHTFTMVFTSTSPFGIHLFHCLFLHRNVFFLLLLPCRVTIIVLHHHHHYHHHHRRHHHFYFVGIFRLLHVNLNLSSEYKMNINIV